MRIYLHNWDITPMVKHLFFFSSMFFFHILKTHSSQKDGMLVNIFIVSEISQVFSFQFPAHIIIGEFYPQQPGDDRKKSRRPS